MRLSPAVIFSVVGALIIAACSERTSTAPPSIAVGRPDASLIGAATTCDFNAIKSAARAYFTSNQDSAFNYDQALQKAYNGGVDANATNVGWQIGRLVAKERLTSATTNGTAGATYLVDVMRCMSDLTGSAPYPSLPIPQKFLDNGASALTSGIWEIRGGAVNSQLPAAGRVIDSHTNVRAFGLPRWGAEAATSLSWPGATQYAVYGFPTNVGTLVIGAATNINTNEVPANSFELGSIPNGTSKSGIRVGVCVSVDNHTTGVANRIVHNNSEILDNSTLTDLCDYSNTSFVASAPASPSWYASLVHRVGSIMSPRTAFAQTSDCTDCIGGLPSGWSPFGTGAITAASVVLADTVQPSNTVASTTANDSIVVRATINGLPLVGVSIDSIAVENNSGSPAGAVITASNLPVTTDATGMATIKFAVGKPGGYLVTLSGTLDSFRTQSITSALFNVKNP